MTDTYDIADRLTATIGQLRVIWEETGMPTSDQEKDIEAFLQTLDAVRRFDDLQHIWPWFRTNYSRI